MTERILSLVEAEPGVVHITTEAMHQLLMLAGFRQMDDLTYAICDRPERKAQEVNENCMIGRK